MRTRTVGWASYRPITCIALVALAVALFGCAGDSPTGPAIDNDTEDAGDDLGLDLNGDLLGDDCESSEDCPTDGQLCIENTCQSCLSSDECVIDDFYGPAAVCDDGVCEICVAGDAGCVCTDSGSCSGGVGCNGGICRECEDGLEGCACGDDDACDEAGNICMQDLCVDEDCELGEEACPCDDGACDVGLGCMDELCRACDETLAGCPCLDGGCGDGLRCGTGDTCELAECETLGCAPHQLCDDSGAAPRCSSDCEAGYRWLADAESCEAIPSCGADAPGSLVTTCDGQNRLCSPASGSDDAACGDCKADFVQDGAACRAPTQCESLNCATDARACPAEGAEVCGPCLTGFEESDAGVCVSILSRHCDDDAEDPDSILDECQAQHKVCDTLEGGGATCGGCLPSHLLNGEDGTCDERPDCTSAADCAPYADTICALVVEGQPARCVEDTNPCADDGPNWAWNPRALTCQFCAACDRTGEVRVWPYTQAAATAPEACVCETELGYFFDVGADSLGAVACDSDDDAWVTRDAAAAQHHDDIAVRSNMRCAITSIDRFVLENEAGQRFTVMTSELEGNPASLELFETPGNDAFRPDDADRVEGFGRDVYEGEVNSLTKACRQPDGDFNHNDITDHTESGGANPSESWMTPFTRFSYFTELHSASVEPTGGAFEALVITERPRWDTDSFGLRYGSVDEGGTYWRECYRRRASDYDRFTEEPWYDFAEWTCLAEGGDGEQSIGCESINPLVASPPETDRFAPPHSVQTISETPGTSIVDAFFGMHHHSQFRCVELDSRAPAQLAPPLMSSSVISRSGHTDELWSFQRCDLEACEADDAECRWDFACNSIVENLDTSGEARIGWAARRFEAYSNAGAYQNGCIDEATEWPELCPGIDKELADANVATGNQPNANIQNFGKLYCACGPNFAGSDCAVGCPDTYLHHGGTGEVEDTGETCLDSGLCTSKLNSETGEFGRTGFWMCLEPRLTAPAVTCGDLTCGDGETCWDNACRTTCSPGCGEGESCQQSPAGELCMPSYSLRGQVSITPVHRVPMRQGSAADCGDAVTCPAGEICMGGSCFTGSGSGLACDDTTPCAADDEHCTWGYCVRSSGYVLH